jgi:hypothetical protein
VPAHKASPVQLSDEYERQLTDLVRAHSTPQRLAERARIVFLAGSRLGHRRNRTTTGGFGARPPVTGGAGGGMRHHPPAWRRV